MIEDLGDYYKELLKQFQTKIDMSEGKFLDVEMLLFLLLEIFSISEN